MNEIVRTSKQIGSQIQRYRKLAELSQSELAELVGLRQATISNIESGNAATRIDTVLAILAALDLEIQLEPRTKSSSADIEAMF